MRNVHDKVAEAKRTYETRFGFGVTFDGPFWFRTQVGYRPISSKDESKLHQFGNMTVPGIFMGNVLRAGAT